MGRVGKSPKTIGCSILSSIALSLYLSLWGIVLKHRGNSASRVNVFPLLSMLQLLKMRQIFRVLFSRWRECIFLWQSSLSPYACSMVLHIWGKDQVQSHQHKVVWTGQFSEQGCMVGNWDGFMCYCFLILNQESKEASSKQLEERKKDDAR